MAHEAPRITADENLPGCRHRAARWLAIVLVGAVAVSLPLTMAARATSRVLFDPKTISTALSANLIDSGLMRQLALQGLYAKETQGEVTSTDFGRVLTYADPQQRQAAADIVIPAGWAQAQLESLTSAFYAWLETDEPLPKLQVDLDPIRQHLLSGGAADLVDLIWSTWPDCTPDQLAQIEPALAAGQDSPLLTCRPPQPEADTLKGTMLSALEAEAASLPVSFSLVDAGDAQSVADLQRAKRFLLSARLLSNWLWLAPASLLGLIVALVVRSWSGLARWWGTALLAGGLGGVVLAALGSPLGAHWLGDQVAGAAGGAPAPLQAAMTGAVTQTYHAVVVVLLRQALLLAAVGGLVGLVGFVNRPKGQRGQTTKPSQQQAAPPSEGQEPGDHPPGMFG